MIWLGLVPVFVWKIIASIVLVGGVYWSVGSHFEKKTLAKVERKNDEADNRGQVAARNSGKRTSSSVLDPYTRVD
jgi:hypothetical protein